MASAMLPSFRKFHIHRNMQYLRTSHWKESGIIPPFRMRRPIKALPKFKEPSFFISEEVELFFNVSQLDQIKDSVEFENPLKILTKILAPALDIELISNTDGNSRRLSVLETLIYVDTDLGVSPLGKKIIHLLLFLRNVGFEGVLPKGFVRPSPLNCNFCILQVCVCYVLKLPFTCVLNVFYGIFRHLDVSNGDCPSGVSVLSDDVFGYLKHIIENGDLARLMILSEFPIRSENLALQIFWNQEWKDLGFLTSFDFGSRGFHGDDVVKLEKPLNSRRVFSQVSKPKALTE